MAESRERFDPTIALFAAERLRSVPTSFGSQELHDEEALRNVIPDAKIRRTGFLVASCCHTVADDYL
jgi:hypothetical protein